MTKSWMIVSVLAVALMFDQGGVSAQVPRAK